MTNKMMPSRSQVCRVVSKGITQPLLNQDNRIDDSCTNSEISTILKNLGLSDIEINNCIKKIIATAKRNRWNIDKIIEGLKWISKNSTSFSNEGIIVNNSFIKYGSYTYKNHKNIKGFFSNQPNSNIVIFGEMKLSWRGMVQEGTFEWISQLQDMALVDGKLTFNGIVQEGTFKWISQLQDMALVDGKLTFNGIVREGKFEYNTKGKGMFLVDGKRTFNGIVNAGKFEYNIELKKMVLVEGKATFNGIVHEGKFEYNTELEEMVLVEGTKKLSNGQDETGKFKYNTELEEMVCSAEVELTL